MAKIIDGKAIAQSIHSEIAQDVTDLSKKYGKVPGLAVVIVGERKDSQTYVRMKRKACAEVGIKSINVDLPGDVSEENLLDTVLDLNADPEVHGILVQLPLPRHINEEKVLSAISIEKDVDGFHPLNIGKLAMKGREPLFVPCTPKGCIELLQRSGVSISNKRAVVVGRSNIVGLPVALLLIKLDATVTMVHSKTPDPKSIISEADIIIAAAGQANMGAEKGQKKCGRKECIFCSSRKVETEKHFIFECEAFRDSMESYADILAASAWDIILSKGFVGRLRDFIVKLHRKRAEFKSQIEKQSVP